MYPLLIPKTYLLDMTPFSGRELKAAGNSTQLNGEPFHSDNCLHTPNGKQPIRRAKRPLPRHVGGGAHPKGVQWAYREEMLLVAKTEFLIHVCVNI